MNYRLLFLILLLKPFFISSILNAQDSIATYQMQEDIVVTANRLPTAFSDVARTVTVITHVEIEKIPAQSVPELLENVLGVDVQQRGTQGIQADISMRGAGFNQTLILLNGLKLSDPQTGHHNMNLPVDIHDIERIEVLKGPGSRLYGPNAFGGVINIITKKSNTPTVSTAASIGENKLYTSLLSFDLPSENASNRITFSKAASDGYKFNTDFHTVNFSQNSQLRIDNLTFLLSSGYNEKHFGANNFYIPIFPNPNQYEETKLAYAQSGLIYQREQFSFRQQVYLRKHNDEYFWNKFESEPNIHESVTMGTELSAQLNHVYGITSAGFEYISESLESNSLGIEEKRNRYGLFTHERHTSGLFLQHQLAWNKLLLNVGGSLYHYTDEGWHGWPGIDLAYKWSAHSKMYASYSEGFRVPTYTNLYLNFPASALPFVRAFGNETLKNEQSQNYEAGYKYSGESIILEAALFQRNDKNIVDYVYNTADTLYRAENILKLATIGFEGGLKFRNPIKGVQSLYTQYSYLDPDTDLSGKITIYALSHFKHQLLAGIDLYLPGFPNLSSNWKVRYEERIISNAHTLIDTRLSWKNDFLRLYLDITNLLDVEYEDIPGVRMPGRWAKLGFEYNLLSQ